MSRYGTLAPVLSARKRKTGAEEGLVHFPHLPAEERGEIWGTHCLGGERGASLPSTSAMVLNDHRSHLFSATTMGAPYLPAFFRRGDVGIAQSLPFTYQIARLATPGLFIDLSGPTVVAARMRALPGEQVVADTNPLRGSA